MNTHTIDEKSPRGTVQKFKDARGRTYYRARITFPDGERLWLKPRFDRKERAREYADEKSREAEKRGITVAKAAPVAKGETCDKFFDRLFAHKKAIGKGGSVRQDASKYRTWISGRIGHLAITAPREELAAAIEELRDDLNDAVRAYVKLGKPKQKDKSRTSGRNAAQIWGVLVTGFNYARTAEKRSGLRVRSDNPCEGIRAPEKSPDKYKTVLRPTEWLALAQCAAVPSAWRETYAVLLYTYVRPGEGRVFEWPDVDFTTNKIRVARAWDYEEECTKATKTWETRDVPIEPTLLPLLKAMHKRASGRGLVLPMLSGQADELSVSKVFREHLEAAGVTRPDLFAASQTQIRIRLRSLRDIGITWRLWRGDNPFAVQRNAGHKRFTTTEKYIGDIEKLSADCGVPFPLIASKFASKESGPTLQPTGTFEESAASPEGFEAYSAGPFEGLSRDSLGVQVDSEQRPPSDNPAMSGRLDASLDASGQTMADLEQALDLALETGRVEVARRIRDRMRAWGGR